MYYNLLPTTSIFGLEKTTETTTLDTTPKVLTPTASSRTLSQLMDMIPLKAQVRDASAKPRKMRRDGRVPCVLYGNKIAAVSISCEERELHRVFAKAGESTLVELDMGEKKVPVLFKAITFEPVSGREEHADFYVVDMKQEIETQVPVHFEGEAPAIKEQGGIFVTAYEHVTVRCLPSDLPHNLTVDISGLVELHSSVSVKDLKLPKGVKVMEDPATVLATVQEPRKEEEIAPPAAEAVPVEGAAPVEGAPAATAEAAPAAAEKGKKK